MKVTVFGGSEPKPGDSSYEQAYQLGRLLADTGHTVITGGYMGTMEAVSRGAAEENGHVIGITCDEIEVWRAIKPNEWVKEELRFPTLRQRLFCLIESCDAAIALPGGIGTLAEVAEMWSHLQTRIIKPRPLILIGQGWHDIYTVLISRFENYIAEENRKLIQLAPNPHTAIEMLKPGLSGIG